MRGRVLIIHGILMFFVTTTFAAAGVSQETSQTCYISDSTGDATCVDPASGKITTYEFEKKAPASVVVAGQEKGNRTLPSATIPGHESGN